MIDVYAARVGGRATLVMRGHAGFAPAGQDIVCAGASALVHALAGMLGMVEAEGLYIDLAPGRASVACTRTGLADALFYQTVIGLAQLAQAYPACVQVRTRGFFAAEDAPPAREKEEVS